MVEFERVSFRYGRGRADVLADFSWRPPPGRTVLLGPNGAGKSTLLGLAANAFAPHHGTVRYADLDPSRRRDQREFRRRVGLMPQNIRPTPGFTAREQVAYSGWLKGMREADSWRAAARALDQVGLSAQQNSLSRELSGGRLRRVGLAQLLVAEPEVLLLDEPTAGLDPAQRVRFQRLLADLSPERTVIVSTHQVDDLLDVYDSVAVLASGEMCLTVPVPEFLALGSGDRTADSAYARLVGEER